MLNFAKKPIKKILSLAGYELVRRKSKNYSSGRRETQQFGLEPFRDLAALVSDNANAVIFDVGASRGQTLLSFLQYYPSASIYCFEPYQTEFEQLKQISSEWDNVYPHQLAFGNENGITSLFLNSSSETNSLLKNSASIAEYSPQGWVDPVGTVDVQVERLDSFCARNQIERIDILKIDTQGFEVKVLEGVGKMLDPSRIAFIYLEVLFVSLYEEQAYFEEVYASLRQHGYRFAGLYHKCYNDQKVLMWADALFL
jgi:FkbM family methyltransferase